MPALTRRPRDQEGRRDRRGRNHPALVIRAGAAPLHAQWDGGLTLALIAIGGARLTSVYMPGQRIKQLFGVLIVVMTTDKIIALLV